MSIEQAKAELQHLRTLDARINTLVELHSQALNKAQKITRQSYDHIISNTIISDKVGNSVANAEELRSLINRTIDEYTTATRRIRKTLDRMENINLIYLLSYRYLCGLTWPETAKRLNYSLRYATKLHNQALKEYAKHMPTSLEDARQSI